MTKTIHSFKGFDSKLQCRGFQYEPGKSYSLEGKIEACGYGFHACEYPLDVFGYYPPATSRFFTVEQSGDIDREGGGDTKIASARITIGVELSIADIVARAVKWIFDRAKPEKGSSATGYQGAASATGDRGAASATGEGCVAVAIGYEARAMATAGNGVCLAHRDDAGKLLALRASMCGENGIEAGHWYSLDINGKFFEVEEVADA